MIDSIKPEKQTQLPIDVGAQQIGRIYAQALLGAAAKTGKTAEVVEEFDWLIAVLDEHPELAALLSSAMIKPEEKSAVIARVFAARLSPAMMDFLNVVSNHGRLEALRAMHHELGKLYDELRGRIRVRLSTAVPLNGQVSTLEDGLRKLLGGEPEIETVVEPELIGGVVLRVGDTVYDGSVARQLQQVREQIINRSVHEIQSRRDRFRYPS